jgi:RNA polymerase sigma-70 factor (ECF subfamily)
MKMQGPLGNLSDHDIVRRVREGDIDAFEPLLRKYKEDVLKIVTKHIPYPDAEEIAHEVFVRAYQSLANFKGKGGFKQWLSVIAVRTCYDYWRRKYRSREVPMSSLSNEHRDWLEKVISTESSRLADEKMSQQEAREVLDWVLGKLSAADRMVLELIYLEGLSAKEVSNLLGWSLVNVRVRSFRSCKKFRKILTGLIQG